MKDEDRRLSEKAKTGAPGGCFGRSGGTITADIHTARESPRVIEEIDG